MIYSCWNQGKGAYDYYEDAARQESLNAPSPKHLRSSSLGATVDQASWPLPAGARYVGSGAAAVGRVASRTGGAALGAMDLGSPTTKAFLLVVSAALAWKYLLKGRR